MHKLPQHQSSKFLDSGIAVIRIDSQRNDFAPVCYAHQDNYYIFGLLESGTGHGIIDLEEHCLSAGDVFLIQPGQVHRFADAIEMKGWLLMADSKLVGHAEKCIFDKFSLFASAFPIDEPRRNELSQMAQLMANRLNAPCNQVSRAITTRLAEAFIGIIAEAMQTVNMQQLKHTPRHVDLVLSFRHLLSEHIATCRQPSYYASLLNISTVYLNEIVKEVTGMSSTLYIKNEVVLQAKRLLVHSALSIKEIAARLGFEDHAYFSRLFTRATGISPAMFRQKYLE